jgi:hypothetical protein
MYINIMLQLLFETGHEKHYLMKSMKEFLQVWKQLIMNEKNKLSVFSGWNVFSVNCAFSELCFLRNVLSVNCAFCE